MKTARLILLGKVNFFISLLGRFVGIHIFDESVSLLSLDGNLVNFNESRKAVTLISCIGMCRILAPYSTSVGYCLFDSRLTRASIRINERLHTFFMHPLFWRPGSK